MSRTTGITCAAVIAVFAKPNNHMLTLEELGAQFSITDQGAWYHVRKLLETGDLFIAKGGKGGVPAQYALTNPPERYQGEIVSPFRSDNWKPAMSGYERGLRAAASLAMVGR
jgi:hypothetical protein